MGENGVVLVTGWFETKRVLGWTVAMGSHRSIEGHDSPPPVDVPASASSRMTLPSSCPQLRF
jgi:hypothetical protein